MINARAETVREKPSFRSAYESRRLIVPVSGFYEWQREGTQKQPFAIRRADQSPLPFAGLWERWHDLETFTIITKAANDAMRPVHDRVPLILSPGQFDGIRPTEERILEALAVYRFLTPAQFLRLSVTTSSSHLYDTLRSMSRRRPAAIHELSFGTAPGAGRQASIYLLTPHGADVLADIDRIWVGLKAHRHIRVFTNDYAHRVGCVDFHIALRKLAQATQATVDRLDTYYDPTAGGGPGRKPPPKTHIAYPGGAIVPDVTFSLTDRRGDMRLYAFELYRGMRTDRVMDQLTAYLPAIASGAIEDAYNYAYSARILCIFDSATELELVCKRIRPSNELAREGARFFLSTRDGLEQALPSHWWRFDGTPATPFG